MEAVTLRRVSIRVDGIEVGDAVIDIELDLPEGAELVWEGTSVLPINGELTREFDPDEWARMTEHFVFSNEAGEL